MTPDHRPAERAWLPRIQSSVNLAHQRSGRSGLDVIPPALDAVEAPQEPTLAKLSDKVYVRVLEAIVAGEYPPARRLPSEAALAERYGVSRPCVREALARLRDQGVIVSRQGSGSFVQRRPSGAMLRFAPLSSIADIQRCFEFRLAVEVKAAALAAERRRPDEMERIAASFAALEEALKTEIVGADADFAFHAAIADAAGNRFFSATLSMLELHMRTGMDVSRNLSLGQPAARRRLVQDEHLAILEAIRARDTGAAKAAMARHIDNARQRMFES